MVLRYAHPQEQHKAHAIKKLEKANAAAQIAEFARAATISATVSEMAEGSQAVN
jgi:hypothetical protein